jgi:hypothetical protein
MTALGILLVLVLAVLYGVGIRAILQVPFRALGILVGGMAFHNAILMILLRLGTPHLLVRVVQAWKEGIMLLLLVLTARMGLTAWRAGRRPRLLFLDWLMVAFAALVVLYGLIPSNVFGVHVTLTQKLIAGRIDLLLPLFYLFGRVFWTNRRADLIWSIGAIVGSAAVVGLLGVIELWFIPTRDWLDFGVNQLSAWFGFTYHGPGGLPENFFQTSSEGPLLRRAVSTYVSPLGIAYSGLIIVPLAVAFAVRSAPRSRVRAIRLALLALVLVGILLSLTREAIGLVVAEVGLFALLFRRLWLVVAAGVLAAAALFMLYGYPQVGPLVDRHLFAAAHPQAVHIVSSNDPSLREHASYLGYDLEYVLLHPLGTGLGTAVHRFGASQGTGESAVSDVFGELGVVGGALYLPTYFLMTLAGLRAYLRSRSDALVGALPLVAAFGGLALFVITLTSDVWGDFPVTFLFWWAAGYAVSLTALPGSGQIRSTE